MSKQSLLNVLNDKPQHFICQFTGFRSYTQFHSSMVVKTFRSLSKGIQHSKELRGNKHSSS